MDSTVKTILIIFFVIIVIYLMSVLSSLLIPLVLAILFASLFQPLILKLSGTRMPNWFILPIVVIITLGIFFGLFNIILSTTTQIAEQKDFLLERLEIRLSDILVLVNYYTGQSLTTENLTNKLSYIFDAKWVSSFAGNLVSNIGSFTGSFLMFILYYLVLLAGMANFKNYIEYVGAEKKEIFKTYIEQIQHSIIKYMIIKVIISCSTGLIIYLVCLAFGIKFAMFWGFLTFVLNFIPSIGSIISTTPAVLMAVIQYDNMEPALFMLLIMIVIQFSIGNFLEPKIMGDRLKLNTLTVIFGLVFWGYIWGIPGMILSVPLMVLLKLIFENSPSLSVIARVMSSMERKTKV